MRSLFHMVPWPSGKARVCKTLIRQFKSGRYLQKEKHTKGVLFFLGSGQDLNNHKCDMPVAYRCHQFKNWWLLQFMILF